MVLSRFIFVSVVSGKIGKLVVSLFICHICSLLSTLKTSTRFSSGTHITTMILDYKAKKKKEFGTGVLVYFYLVCAMCFLASTFY
ncbi:hypothetical protein AQUCO_02400056v1 [Aquilegia coerulea]|uniref:Uncharacterized protein n=1 Tax=Aquilegia coerulea TaxID=218851 RepID=A0A2G5DB81_AQUCA|nr:hypothetical protein AQUCO_02400056v1 [Aquilegia coerulea]